MLTVSLHGIKLHAPIGLYPEEKIHGNDFEVDVDVFADTSHTDAFPFIDYAVVYELLVEAFQKEGELLETFVKYIHTAVKAKFPEAAKVRVTIRKLAPPLGGEVRYSQVCYES
ncbi:MAG TPA: dihydroneopterin aldolase [Flavipsychrobacter sp.]|nr:dihydroneopterin aldolase [Flavipsychrobacter sp.]